MKLSDSVLLLLKSYLWLTEARARAISWIGTQFFGGSSFLWTWEDVLWSTSHSPFPPPLPRCIVSHHNLTLLRLIFTVRGLKTFIVEQSGGLVGKTK